MIALLQNELVLYGIIIALVAMFIIGKFIGFRRFFGWFSGSGKRVETAKAKSAANAEAPKAPSGETTA